ncbi:hypothetical protein [Cupriavidus campinensis]
MAGPIKTRMHPGSRSTADGLAALLYHLVHATSQGQLDPAFARLLGRHIRGEIEAYKAASPQRGIERDMLDEAVSRFDHTLVQSQSHQLLDAVRCIGSGESATASRGTS